MSESPRRTSAVNRAVLHALASGVAEGHPDRPLRALPPSDPLVRWLARRRLARRLRGVWLEAAAAPLDDGPDLVRHGLRVGWLQAAGEDVEALWGDPEATIARYDAAPRPPPPPTGWRLTVPLAVVLIGVIVAAALLLRPPRDPLAGPVGEALAGALPKWVVDLDRWAAARERAEHSQLTDEREAALTERRAAVLSAPARQALGPEASAALEAALDATRAMAAPAAGPETLPPWRAALADLNDALEAAAAPYFIDGAWMDGDGRRQAALFVYDVRSRRQVQGGAGEPIRALHLRRLDRLNWDQSLLGYTRRSMRVAVVTVDAVEAMMLRYVGPALGHLADMPLFERASSFRPKLRDRVTARAGAIARESWEAALPEDRGGLRQLGDLLAKRRELFERWRGDLKSKGLALEVPDRVELPGALLQALEDTLPDYEVRELRVVQGELEGGSVRDLFDRMVDAYAVSVEQHEVQHRLDYARGDAFPVPAAIVEATGLAPAEDGTLPRFLERTCLETSAYLAELARSGGLALLNLTLLSRHYLDVGNGGTAEWYAAALIFRGLSEELSLETEREQAGRMGRARLSRLYLRLSNLPTEKLTKAAAALWERWFQGELAPLTRVAP